MKSLPLLLALALYGAALGSSELQQMYDTELKFGNELSAKGAKTAYLEYLTEDGVIFVPSAANGRDWWSIQNTATPHTVRTPLHVDISSNGLIGYTTGIWRSFKNRTDKNAENYGQYATIWRRMPDGSYRIVVDLAVRNAEALESSSVRSGPAITGRDANERGWSAADSYMAFLRSSMAPKGLSRAYKKHGREDMRLLRENLPPLYGKLAAVAETKQFRAVGHPQKVAMVESGDMAYVWNQCEFAENDEGRAAGNCLHVWKLTKKKWHIVLGVLSTIPVQKPPTLLQRFGE
ncbi:MAG: hypothetical protein QUS14_13675 [Pyrinomonadaceae bacterium]|nr:hypothetical protein [Pyrinomonadaceae bacterium]